MHDVNSFVPWRMDAGLEELPGLIPLTPELQSAGLNRNGPDVYSARARTTVRLFELPRASRGMT